jgi:phospholipase/carboxylesterase
MQKGVQSAAATLDSFLDAELARRNLPPERLALVGFSQGTMMSLHVGLNRAVKPAAIVGYSGMLAGAENLGTLGDAPPIMLIHGDADPMIPADALFMSAGALARAGAGVQWHLSPGIGHSIDPEGLSLGGVFLAMAFAGLLKRANGEIACEIR